MSSLPATTAPHSRSTALARAEMPAVIVGFRRDGGTIVLLEAGGAEHRLTGALDLWALVGRLIDASTGTTTIREDSRLKKERTALAEAFLVLGRKAKAHAAERVGEDTVGALETITKVAGGQALNYLRRTSIRGGNALVRRERPRR